MSLTAHHITYIHPDNETLLRQIDLILPQGQKAALIGNNGCGKSTLLKILAGEITPQKGEIAATTHPYYVPQHFGQYDRLTISDALGISRKLEALYQITAGNTAGKWFDRLGDDWLIEQRSRTALTAWGLGNLPLSAPLSRLSGGEKTKVFLAGMQIHSPTIILMDEPTNHLDTTSREKVYTFISTVRATLLVVSHDRELLNRLPTLYELTPHGITAYGGNYDFYKRCKETAEKALAAELGEKEKTLRQAKQTAREMAERKQKQNARGEKAGIRKRISRMAVNTLKDKAEKSTTKLTDIHAEKIENTSEEVARLRGLLADRQHMQLNFEASGKPKGKRIVSARQLTFSYSGGTPLWKQPLDFQLLSGERVAIQGNNGTGKTTLLKLIAGYLEPTAGCLERNEWTYVYVDQEYSLIHTERTLYEQVQAFNTPPFREDELKTRLHRYLFPSSSWNKRCATLSGGEKMRLMFCCLMIRNQTPDLLILDEPTNNLDIQSIEIITETVRQFEGTILVVSHDTHFLREIGIQRSIELV